MSHAGTPRPSRGRKSQWQSGGAPRERSLKDALGTSAGTAAVACGAFSATMTIGRLLADRVVEWLGSGAVLRYGASRPSHPVSSVTASTARVAPRPAVVVRGSADSSLSYRGPGRTSKTPGN